MLVQRLDPRCYRVLDGNKRYRATLVTDDDTWCVVALDKLIRDGSAVYRRVVEAVTDAIATGDYVDLGN